LRLGLSDYLVKDANGEILKRLPEVIDRLIRAEASAAGEGSPYAMLRNAQVLLSALYDHSPNAIILLDETTIYDCNKAALELFGCTTIEDMLRRNPRVFAPATQPDGRETKALVEERIAAANRHGSCKFDLWYQRLDGTMFCGEVTLAAVDLGGKKLLHALVRDITHRKRWEDDLCAQQDFLEDLVDERTGELICANARLQQSNEDLAREIAERKASEATLQRRTQELADRVKELNCLHALRAVLQDAEASEEQLIRRVLAVIPRGLQHPEAARARVILEDKVYATDGFEDTSWRMSSAIMLGNRLAGSVDVCYRDDRLATGEALFLERERSLLDDAAGLLSTAIARRRADAEVRLLTRQIEFILGASKTGLSIIDADFRVVYIDRRRQEIFGPPQGKQCFQYFRDRDTPCEECEATKAIRSHQIMIREDIAFREESRPVQITTIPFQNDKGEWLVAQVSMDISERKRMEGELAQSQRMEAIGQLAAGKIGRASCRERV
jgi:PAS domain S-box-containing protein